MTLICVVHSLLKRTCVAGFIKYLTEPPGNFSQFNSCRAPSAGPFVVMAVYLSEVIATALSRYALAYFDSELNNPPGCLESRISSYLCVLDHEVK